MIGLRLLLLFLMAINLSLAVEHEGTQQKLAEPMIVELEEMTVVGIQTADTANQRDAQQVLVDQLERSLDSARGVNLDEEAADLIRYEQMYQASAQTMAVASTLFETLIAALRR